ncbi:MAG: DNA polymerase III subunit beta [Gammaproteobacteria bacterium]|nr:DNA polymerase III subunit beta [Gammaproteobacteria bacterium]
MRLTMPKEELVKRLSMVAGVVERRQTRPILSNVLIEAGQGKVSLTGTDLEVEMVTWAQAQVTQEGATTVPGRKFLDIVRALPAHSEVDIQREEDRLKISAGRSRFLVSTMPAVDFPSIDTVAWEVNFAVDGAVLRKLIEKTQFCMAQQDVRYYLNGLMLETMTGSLKAVAADGHRLALCEERLEGIDVGEKQVIVPRKGVVEMTRFLAGTEGPVEVRLASNHIRVEGQDVVFTSKLIDGRFPDYNRVVPNKVQEVAVLGRDMLREMLGRVGVVSSEKHRGVRLVFSGTVLTASTHNPERDEASEELALGKAVGNFEVGFNVGYLVEAISAIEGEEIEMGWNDINSGCRIRDAAGDGTAVYVVMPMRL